jgi:hypothetical protein
MEKSKIYTFSINLEKEVEESNVSKQKNKETGKMEEVQTVKKVLKDVPYSITLYEPSRRQVEDADMEFSIEMSKCIKRGILTKAMLAKKYSDSGGLLTEEDSSKLVRSYSKLGDLQKDLGRLMAKKKKNKEEKDAETKLTQEFAEVRRDIVDLETAYQNVFNHTADTKAQNRTILWYLINLSFVTDPAGIERPMFEGEDYDAMLDEYYQKDEKGDEIYDLCREKLMAFISFWYFSQNASQEDFQNLEEEIETGVI